MGCCLYSCTASHMQVLKTCKVRTLDCVAVAVHGHGGNVNVRKVCVSAIYRNALLYLSNAPHTRTLTSMHALSKQIHYTTDVIILEPFTKTPGISALRSSPKRCLRFSNFSCSLTAPKRASRSWTLLPEESPKRALRDAILSFSLILSAFALAALDGKSIYVFKMCVQICGGPDLR